MSLNSEATILKKQNVRSRKFAVSMPTTRERVGSVGSNTRRARDTSPGGSLDRGARNNATTTAATTDGDWWWQMASDICLSWSQPVNEAGGYSDITSNPQADCEGESNHKLVTYKNFALMLLAIVGSVGGIGLVNTNKTGDVLATFGGFAAKTQSQRASKTTQTPSSDWIEKNVLQKIGVGLLLVLAVVFFCINIVIAVFPKCCLSLVVVSCAVYSMQLHEQPGSLRNWDGELKRLPSMITLRKQRDKSSDVCLQFRTHIDIQDDAWTLFDMMWGEHSSRETTLVTVREKITSSKRSFDACASNVDQQSIQVAEWIARDDKQDGYTDLLQQSSLSCPPGHRTELQKQMQNKCTGMEALPKDAQIPVHSRSAFKFLDDAVSCNWAAHQVKVECHEQTEEDQVGQPKTTTHWYIPHCKPSEEATYTVPCGQANLLHCAFKNCVADLEELARADKSWYSSFFERRDTHWQGMQNAAFPPKPRVKPPETQDKSLHAGYRASACVVTLLGAFLLAVNHLKTDSSSEADTSNSFFRVLFVILLVAIREIFTA